MLSEHQPALALVPAGPRQMSAIPETYTLAPIALAPALTPVTPNRPSIHHINTIWLYILRSPEYTPPAYRDAAPHTYTPALDIGPLGTSASTHTHVATILYICIYKYYIIYSM